MTYEKALARLEEITRQLEERSLNLDDSLRLFETGVELSRFCLQRLAEAENRVEIILKDQEGKIQTDRVGKPKTKSFTEADNPSLPPSSAEEDESN